MSVPIPSESRAALTGLDDLRIAHELEAALRNLPVILGRCALLVDADRTLGPHDTGRLLGERLGLNETIRSIFERMGYVENAFAKVSEVWSCVPAHTYQEECETLAQQIRLYPEWLEIFNALHRKVPIIVVSAGIAQPWRRLVAKHGYDIPVIGGCHADVDSYFVHPGVKKALVVAMQRAGWGVIACGDSPIDAEMIMAANVGVLVPDAKGSGALRSALPADGRYCHLVIDDRRFEGFTPIAPADLIRRAIGRR